MEPFVEIAIITFISAWALGLLWYVRKINKILKRLFDMVYYDIMGHCPED